jgi:RecA/RadA recombinase
MAKNALLEKLKAAGSLKVSTLAESALFNEKDFIQTSVPSINVAFSGRLDGGMCSGLTIVAGPSKHFKSSMSLIMVKAYMDKYQDGICLFYDSEYGVTPEYVEDHGVDTERIIHIPVEHVEQLKFDIVKRLEQIERGDHVIIFIDSIGNLASKKEVEDALDEKSVTDMSRAKALKSLFRIITPHLTTKDIPCVAVNHTYQEIGMFPKQIVGGGTGLYYSANQIFIIGRSQEKGSSGEIEGWNFTLNVEKSRFVKEKAKLPIQVSYEGGINPYSGLLEWALESGHVTKPKNGWFQSKYMDKNVREKDTNNMEFWSPIVTDQAFVNFIKTKFMLNTKRALIEELETDEE